MIGKIILGLGVVMDVLLCVCAVAPTRAGLPGQCPGTFDGSTL